MDAKRATLRDVAAAAGVSRALAGFVLGDDHGKSIPEATRQRVREAARSLGYAPHGIARALREGSSRVVVLSIDPSLELPDGLDGSGPRAGYDQHRRFPETGAR